MEHKVQIFVLMFCLIRLSACQEDPKTDVEVVDAATAEPTAEPSEDELPPLDEKTCMEKRTGCCESVYFGDDTMTLVRCFVMHQGKAPEEESKDITKAVRFISCFVECLFKRKKYTGKGDTINMKMVKNDAEKIYAGKPKEKDYNIAMYEYCGRKAVSEYGLFKNNPAAKFLLKDACRPYFLFVFLCVADYHKNVTCPYFRWEGKRNTEHEEKCKLAKSQCYEIDGIHTS